MNSIPVAFDASDAASLPGAMAKLAADPFLTIAEAPDVPGDMSSTISLPQGTLVQGEIDRVGDTDWYVLHLQAGHSYKITLLAAGVNPLGDPYLNLYDSQGALVGDDDDGAGDLNAALRFTAQSNTPYYVSAQAFGFETGRYTIKLEVVGAQDPLDTIDYHAQLANPNLTVYFLTTGESAYGQSATADWSAAQKAAFFAAGATFSAVAGVSFTETSDRQSATMVVGLNANLAADGLMTTPDQGAPAIGLFNPSGWAAPGTLAPGGQAFATLLHELGHALGLAHPSDHGGGSDIMEGVLGPYGSYGDAGLNQGAFTIMGYNDGLPGLDRYSAATGSGHQASPMALDIALLQEKYGASVQAPGDTVYDLTDVANRFVAIWDTGGVDTIRYTGSDHYVIDLRPATLLNAEGGGGYVSDSRLGSVSGGYTIAAGVAIENATGGSGYDILHGNDLANALTGNAGDDILTGGAGADILFGGAGVDTAVFSGPMSAYTLTPNGTGLTVTGPDGADTLSEVELLQFSDQTFHFHPGAGTAVSFTADPSTYAGALRDFDGNDLGAAGSWVLAGHVDVQGDGDQEYVLFNRQIGRWATIGPASDGKVYFDDHGWGGDTRVVGTYIDPLVAAHVVAEGGPNDSQRRFANDLSIGNLKAVLGGGDYDHDGLQEVYFSLTDGTAYLHAYMHADGNIRYANYQDQQQVIDYLTANGFTHTTWDGWF